MYPRLSMREFCDTAAQVMAELPEPFHEWLENVVVEVEPTASPAVRKRLRLRGRPPMGLFIGLPVDDQRYGERAPNRILLFKDTIESVCRSKEEVKYEIRRTVLHEVAHHFGYSEEDLDDFEARESPFDQPHEETP
ncbi:MAG: metallopeptidase family protein [Pirellulales bacterium]